MLRNARFCGVAAVEPRRRRAQRPRVRLPRILRYCAHLCPSRFFSGRTRPPLLSGTSSLNALTVQSARLPRSLKCAFIFVCAMFILPSVLSHPRLFAAPFCTSFSLPMHHLQTRLQRRGRWRCGRGLCQRRGVSARQAFLDAAARLNQIACIFRARIAAHITRFVADTSKPAVYGPGPPCPASACATRRRLTAALRTRATMPRLMGTRPRRRLPSRSVPSKRRKKWRRWFRRRNQRTTIDLTALTRRLAG